MRTFLISIVLLGIAHASTSTLTGKITNAQGSGINGTLIMTLPVPATDGSSAISPGRVVFRLVNGTITGGAPLYDVASLQPTNLYYSARAYDTAGFLQFYGNYGVTGATYNLAAAIPTTVTTSNISYLNPATTNGNNTFSGTNIFTQGLQINVSGTGCGQSLFLQNTDTSPTNPNKYLRINQTTGALELMNSGCNTTIVSISDTGAITAPSLTAPGSIGLSLGLKGGQSASSIINGGDVNVSGGDATVGNKNGGNVNLSGGQPSGSGVVGVVEVNGTPQIFYVIADFTLAANTNLQAIPMTPAWVLVPNTAQKVPFSCHLLYSQATAAVADQFGVQAASLAPTNFMAKARVQTNSTAYISQNLPTLNTTTATAVVTFTPSAITTIWEADIDGLIENPSGVANTINIMAQTSNASDLVTIKKDSFCRID